MTPTEEQMEAIRDVSDLPRAIGCTQCHSYIQEHYGNQFAILRAMIDSSDHIVEPDELIGFDLEKARAVDIDLLAATDWGELRARYRAALAEIERLRVEMDNYGDDFVCQMKSKDARIKELEDAHKRSGAKYAKIINELRSSVYANIPGLKKQWDEILNAPANGKIGPDADAKPRSWQITEERKAALWHATKVLKENDIMEEPEEHLWDEEVTVLQAMLTEAGQE